MAWKLHVKICEGQNLCKMDLYGKSNPYITLRLKSQDQKETLKTQIICNTIEPIWNEEFDILVSDPNDVLLINMFDEDIRGDEKMMDELQFPVNTWLVGGSLDKKEIDIKLDEKSAGKLFFEVQAFPIVESEEVLQSEENIGTLKNSFSERSTKSEDDIHTDYSFSDDFSESLDEIENDYIFLPIKLIIHVIKCHNLPKIESKPPNSYLTLSIKNNQDIFQRTKVVHNSCNPNWNETFEFLLNDEDSNILVVNIMNENSNDDVNIINEIEFPFQNWPKDMHIDLQKEIKFANQEAGTLYLSIDILDENSTPKDLFEEMQATKEKFSILKEQVFNLQEYKDKLEQEIKTFQNEKKDIEKEIDANCSDFINCLNETSNRSQKLETLLKKIKTNLNNSQTNENKKEEGSEIQSKNSSMQLKNSQICKMTDIEKEVLFNKIANDNSNDKFNISIQEFFNLTYNINSVSENQFNYMIDFYNYKLSKKEYDCLLIFNNLTKVDSMMLKRMLKLDGFSINYLSQTAVNEIANKVLLYDSLFQDMEKIIFLNENLNNVNQNRRDNYLKTSKKTYYSLYNQCYHEVKIFNGSTCIEKYLFDGYNIEKVFIPKSVLRIEENAFYNCRNLTTISLKCINLTKIGKSAFSGCQSLKTFIMPKNVEIIEEFTFKKCVKLEKIVFPENLKEIKEKAFANCKTLTEIKLPKTIQKIGAGAFQKCESLKIVIIPGVISIYNHDDIPQITEETSVQNFCISSKCFYKCRELHNMIIHKKCQIIDDSSFNSCAKLENIMMYISPQFKVGNNAFENCEQLRKVNIFVSDKSSLEFCKSSFQNCKQLTDVCFDHPSLFTSNSVKINSNVFNGCENLTKFEFPSNCNSDIGKSCFNGCKKLKSVILPDNMQKIQEEMFKNCQELESINWESESLTIIEDSSFENCYRLKLNQFPPNLIKIGDCAFRNCSLLEFTLFPEKIEEIGRSAFEKCSQIAELVIPSSMKTINKKAFQECSNLQLITNYSSSLKIHNKAFYNCTKLNKIFTNSHDGFSTEAFENCAQGFDFFKIED